MICLSEVVDLYFSGLSIHFWKHGAILSLGDTVGLSTDEGFTIFSNPVRDYLNIQIPDGVESIEVYSISGSIVENVSIKQLGVDVSRLKPGIYMVIVIETNN